MNDRTTAPADAAADEAAVEARAEANTQQLAAILAVVQAQQAAQQHAPACGCQHTAPKPRRSAGEVAALAVGACALVCLLLARELRKR